MLSNELVFKVLVVPGPMILDIWVSLKKMGFGCSGKGFYERKWLVVGWDGRLVLLRNLLNYNKKFKALDSFGCCFCFSKLIFL